MKPEDIKPHAIIEMDGVVLKVIGLRGDTVSLRTVDGQIRVADITALMFHARPSVYDSLWSVTAEEAQRITLANQRAARELAVYDLIHARGVRGSMALAGRIVDALFDKKGKPK